jgi:hypothetical protein
VVSLGIYIPAALAYIVNNGKAKQLIAATTEHTMQAASFLFLTSFSIRTWAIAPYIGYSKASLIYLYDI